MAKKKVRPARATCLREAAFSLRSHFGEGGTAKAGNAAGGFFQHFPKVFEPVHEP